MKKFRNYLLTVSLVSTLILTGCSDKDPEAVQDNFECRIAGSLAPAWACGNSNIDGYVTAVGSAPLSKIGHGFSRREALANGRSNLAQQIETTVKDKVTTYARSTGVKDSEVADKVTEMVSKQVAKSTLAGSKQEKRWQDPKNKDIYILVSISRDSFNKSAKDALQSSYNNKDALWQQFQSKNALEELEAEFE